MPSWTGPNRIWRAWFVASSAERTTYYRKFVHDYRVIAAPLTARTKKDGFSWTKEAAAAFLALKRTVTSTLVLALPDFDKDVHRRVRRLHVWVWRSAPIGQIPAGLL